MSGKYRVALRSDRHSPRHCGRLIEVVTPADDDRMKSKPLFVFEQPHGTGTMAACTVQFRADRTRVVE